jgi:hypothetical protein
MMSLNNMSESGFPGFQDFRIFRMMSLNNMSESGFSG